MRTVQELLGLNPTQGDIGLEIEVEGEDLPRFGNNKFWKAEDDGSLRGESVEYVLKKPLKLDKVWEALLDLRECYRVNESKVGEPFRAGTHVHINCQKLTLIELFNFITLYLVFENVLVNGCGGNRKGNLFCLSSSDAEYLLSCLRSALQNCQKAKDLAFLRHLFVKDDQVRYASINLTALSKYGSLEFRAMRSTPKIVEIFDWVKVLFALKNHSLKFANPMQIVSEFSLSGVEKFMRDTIGEAFAKKYSDFCKDYRADMMDGMRNAQEIAYAVDWGVMAGLADNKPEVKKDLMIDINAVIAGRLRDDFNVWRAFPDQEDNV